MKKVERQFNDLQTVLYQENKRREAEPGRQAAIFKKDYLKIGTSECTPDQFISNFKWEDDKFTYKNKSLKEIIAKIASDAATADEELKKMAKDYGEKAAAVGAAHRRAAINLGTSDFEDIFSPSEVSKLDLIGVAAAEAHDDGDKKDKKIKKNAERSSNEKAESLNLLQTLLVSVPRALEKEFLETYNTLGAEIASYGLVPGGKFGENSGREIEKGSPVVPGSAVKVLDDKAKDANNIMYSVVALAYESTAGHFRKEENGAQTWVAGKRADFIEPLKNAFREKKYTLRVWAYDRLRPSVAKTIEQTEKENGKAFSQVNLWCKAHFGELYSGFVHLKVVKCYIESVLRYGLPPINCTFFVQFEGRNEKQMRYNISRGIAKLRPELAIAAKTADEEEEGGEEIDDNLPFVLQKVALIGEFKEEKN